jgi:hypothetical protein
MRSSNRSTPANGPKPQRSTTIEMVRLCCPDINQSAMISESFGLHLLDSAGIRDFHERALIESAQVMSDALTEKAMKIHFQRIAGSFVGSAYGAGQFYSKAVSEAKDVTARLANDVRDEDRGGPAGFDSAAQRKREFAADMGQQAHALLMAAEGTLAAYAKIIGEPWKPYQKQLEGTRDIIDRRAANLQMAAFD